MGTTRHREETHFLDNLSRFWFYTFDLTPVDYWMTENLNIKRGTRLNKTLDDSIGKNTIKSTVYYRNRTKNTGADNVNVKAEI